MTINKKKLIKNTLSIVLILGILYYIIFYIFIPNIAEIKSFEWEINWIYLVLALVIMVIMWVFKTYIWSLILKKMNINIPFSETCNIKIQALLLRYIPGKIWGLIKGGQMLKNKETSFKKSIFVMLLDIFYDLYAAVFLFLTTILFIPEFQKYANIYILIILACSFIFIHPHVISFMVHLGAKIVKKKINYTFEISLKESFVFLFLYLCSWLLTGLSLLFLIMGVTEVSFSFLFPLTGIFALAWSIGFLSLIAPSGFGVREGVLGLLLSVYFPLPIAMVIAFLTRILVTALEVILLMSIPFLTLKKQKQNKINSLLVNDGITDYKK